MKIVIISCFDAYAHRLYFVERFFRKNGHEVQVLLSDFDHMKKARRMSFQSDRNIEVIHVPEYKKNLSMARIYSHFYFAKNVWHYLNQDREYDLIYAMIPPNFLCHYLAKYRRANSHVRLVFDIYDLWPESMMQGLGSKLLKFPFRIWRKLRNQHLKDADYVLTECNLYQKRLGNFLNSGQTGTLYISKQETGIPLQYAWEEGVISFCYIGSINHIIDLDRIVELLTAVKSLKPVKFHVIGDGERRAELVERTKDTGADVRFYGTVYEEEKKREIYGQCHFGLNLMKSSVCVGLSQKSVDYFEAGLPIINSLPYDTEHLVAEWECGLNLSGAGIKELALQICSIREENYVRMRENTKRMFSEVFSEKKIENTLSHMCSKLGFEV